MTISRPSGRDHRIDFIRGLALLSIFINHVPGNPLEVLTHKNFGLTDSAEVFVVLAGVAAAFAYYPRFAEGARLLATLKAVKRAATLYVAHMASITVGIAIFAVGAVVYGRPELMEAINIAPLMADPARGFIGLATMTHQIGYHNILPMYVVLLLSLPLVMALARTGLQTLVGASVVLYAAMQVFDLKLPTYPEEGHWFFNPFAWQLLFVTGFAVGHRLLRGETPVPYVRPLWWLALAYLVAGGVYHYFNFHGSMPELGLPLRFYGNEKPTIAIGRLLHILSLLYVVGHSGLLDHVRRLSPRNPVTLLGRHALPVFWIGTALCMVGQVILVVHAPGTLEQIALMLVGIAIQLGVAFGLDWMRGAEKAMRPTPAPVPTGTALA